jgi:hypothetical protein
MARPNQSEPSLGLDRRQLLAATAVVTAAGIAPNADSAGATNPAQAINAANIPELESPAYNVCESTARKIKEIATRNIIRAEAGLPLLSIPRELRRMKMVEDAAEFEEFADRHRQAVWEEVLAPMREAKGEPNWRPTRWMEGIGFQARVSRIMRERYEIARTSPNRSGSIPAH